MLPLAGFMMALTFSQGQLRPHHSTVQQVLRYLVP